MNVNQVRLILMDVNYKGWLFEVVEDSNYFSTFSPSTTSCEFQGPARLNIRFPVKDSTTGKPIELTFSQGILIHPSMTEQDILGMIFRCIQAAEMHEAAEQFRFKGVMIYNPHKEEQERYKRVQGIGIHNTIHTVGS